jgi:hypothetical protein
MAIRLAKDFRDLLREFVDQRVRFFVVGARVEASEALGHHSIRCQR